MPIWIEEKEKGYPFREYDIDDYFPMSADNIHLLEARGEALEYILEHFEGIPKSKGLDAQTWRNPWATFIFENLK